ncbi:MAG: ATP-binding protein [Bacteroidota bacterium]
MKTSHFKTRARLINQLGDQLIKNNSIALLELVKNSYDADASFCIVEMEHLLDTKKGNILILDDGIGMSEATIRNVWLEIGTSYKSDLNSKPKLYRSPKFKRLPLGEKGIGRLGVHKLGRKIEIISKAEGHDEVTLKIDWDEIENSQYIEDLPVTILVSKSNVFNNSTGTQIRISKPRDLWSRALARECARCITSLNSPFESNDSFNANIKIKNSNWLSGIVTHESVMKYKLFEFDISMEGNKIVKFKYRFVPWATMTKLKGREVRLNHAEINKLLRVVDKGKNDVDLSQFEIGEVRFRGVIFDRDTHVLSLGVEDKKGFKDYLNSNGGIRVYRDNMRVLNYGEKGDDWLGVAGRRVNMPTKRVGNNIILAAVELSREHSTALVEKANREGFVENEAYEVLSKSVLFAIERIESLRKSDKEELRTQYGPQKTTQSGADTMSDLRDVVSKKVKEAPVRDEICRYIDRIESEYESIMGSLMKSAGAGLNLILVIHQMEKIIKDVMIMMSKGAQSGLIESRVKTLSQLVEGYSILVRKSEKKERNLRGIIKQSIFNIEYRLEDHGIKLIKEYEKNDVFSDAVCSEDHVLNSLMNIFDNSIWWLGYAETPNSMVYIDISDAIPGYVSIVVADNGPGFSKAPSELIKPFVSDRPSGMGIGLHLTDQIMLSLGGELKFPENEIFEIPEDFQKGAIIALAFKKNK